MRFGVTLLVVFLFFAVGFVLIRLVRAAGFYRKFRGKRIVNCPETMKPATLDIAAKRAALEALLGQPYLRLIHCSQWPERRTCAQLCRLEMEAEPDISIPEPELCD
jgi:hypothetical protein